MIDSARPPKIASCPIPDRASPGIVDRATTILAQQKSFSGVGAFAAPISALQLAQKATTPEDLQQRALSLLSDLFAYFGVRGDTAGAAASAAADLVVPWRILNAPAAPGKTVSIPLGIENSEARPIRVSFYSTDLLSDNGTHIPSHAVSFRPASLDVEPRQTNAMFATIDVPVQTVPGRYSGLVQAVGLSALKAVVTIDVT